MNSGQGMAKLSNMLYINFPTPKDEREGINVRVCIAGHVGSGKTAFINKMCNKRYETGYQIYTITKDIVYEDSVYMNNSRFRIYDTPGYNSQSEAFRHALTLKATLTKIPYNMILIQVAFVNRFHEITKKIKQQLKIFKGYQNYVVFMISHFDLCQQQKRQDAAKKLGEFLQSLGLKFKFILYSNAKTDFKILCKLLYNIAVKNKPKLVQIDDDKFYQYFNISSPIQNTKQQIIQQYIEQIQQQCKYFIKYAVQLKQKKDKITNINELISDFKMYMKCYLKKFQDKQYQKYMNIILDQIVAFDLYFTISKFIHSQLQQVDQITDKLIYKKFYDSYYQQYFDIRDMFKQCPNSNCKLIWMKTQGCNNTTCGAKPSYFDYFQNNQAYQYQFSIQNGKIVQKKNSQFGKPNPKKQNLAKIKEKGCGRQLILDDLPRLQNIDQILKQVYGANNYKQLMLQIEQKQKKQYQKFKSQLQEHERNTNRIIESDKLNADYKQQDVQKMRLKCSIM